MAAAPDAQLLKGRGQSFVALWATFPKLSKEDARKEAETLLAPGVKFHADGLLYEHDLEGIDAFLAAAQAEHAAYQTLEHMPLVVAANSEESSVFVLSHWKVRHVGAWHGVEPTNHESEGITVDELWVDEHGRVTEAWVRRQMTAEERQALVRHPSAHPFARLDTSDLRPIPEDEASAAQSAGSRMHAMLTWIQAWNLRSETGDYSLDALDSVLAPDFRVLDTLGIRGKYDHAHNIQTRADAKSSLRMLTEQYDVKEELESIAVADDMNIGFAHWKAHLTPKEAAPEGEEGAEGGGHPGARGYTVEATDVAVFDDGGKMALVYQLRTPVNLERRRVIQPHA